MKKIISTIQTTCYFFKNKSISFLKKHQLINQSGNPSGNQPNSQSGNPSTDKKEIHPVDYFALATSWADDFYVSIEAARNRWKALSLFVLLPLLFILLLLMSYLIPSQKLIPLMVNHYSDGQTIVTPFQQHYAPENQSQVESDLARYVQFRESYSADTFDYSYRLINLMSTEIVADTFNQLQNAQNKSSPINVLGNKVYQSVKIESISFLDNENKNNHHSDNSNDHNTGNDHDNKNSNNNPKTLQHRFHQNLAQVNFVVTTHDEGSGKDISTPLSALISWDYTGTPLNPSDRWMDWNGFKVKSYIINQRNI